MFDILRIKPRKKSRKYPIKRDEDGRSARQRSFEAFDRGMTPAEASRQVGISSRTARRYFAQWKKVPENLDRRYALARAMLTNHPELSRDVIRIVASQPDMPEEEVRARLEKPWGIKQLLMGKWAVEASQKGNESKDTRQWARLDAALVLLDLLEQCSISPDRIKAELKRLAMEAREQQGATVPRRVGV